MPASNLTQLPILVAADQGFFRQHGLDVSVQTMAPPVAVAALQSGEVQFISVASSAASAAAQGLPIRVVSPLTIDSFSLVARPDVTTLADLRGQIVGEDKPGNGDVNLYTAAVLQKAGLAPSDVQLLAIGVSTDIYTALLGGQVAAGTLAPPLTQQADAQGYHVLADESVMALPSTGIAANTDTLQNNPALVQSALDALLDAEVWAKSNPDACSAYIAQKFNLDDTVARGAYQDEVATLRVGFDDDTLQGVIDRALASTQTSKSVSLGDVYDLPVYRQFVQAAQARGIQ